MTSEKDVLMSLLKLTHNGQVRKESIASDGRVLSAVTVSALRKFSQENLFREHEGLIYVTPNQRVAIAIRAIQFGADFERVCRSLSWSEFENIAAEAFVANDYRVARNFRFRQASRRWEIDILCFKKPLIICIDCKHWKRWGRSATIKSVTFQVERTEALADALHTYLEKAGIKEWETAILVPTILSLMIGPDKFYDHVPIVPIFQLQGFINELPSEIHSLKCFRRKFLKLNGFLTENSQ
jgi:hypothetical protein